MITENSSTYLFVSNVSWGSASNIKDLPNGSVAVVDAATGDLITSAISDQSKLIKIVKKTSSGKLVSSPVFSLSQVSMKGKNTDNALDTQQISYLGATSDSAVTGMGTLTEGTTYTVNMILKNTIGFINTTPEIKFGAYKMMPGDGEFEFVTGLKDSFERQINYPTPIVKIERVGNGTRTAISAGTGDATSIKVVNGSKEVEFVKAADAAATIETALTVGSIVKIKGIVYKIVTSTTSGFEIDRAYTGVSESILFTDSNTGIYNPTNFGLKFTGLRQEFNAVTDSVEMQLVQFDLVSEDLTVSEYKAQKATPSMNDGARIAYQEKYSQFLVKQPVVSSLPPTQYSFEAVTTEAYKLYTITLEDRVHGSIAIGADYKVMSNIIIALKSNISDAFDTVLGIS